MVAFRVDTIQPSADHRNRTAASLPRAGQRSFVRSAVNACRQPGHDDQPGPAQVGGEAASVVQPAGCGVAAADDRHAGLGQESDAPLRIQDQRRIGGFQQRGGVQRVAERDDPAGRVSAPCQHRIEQGLLVEAGLLQRGRSLGASDLAPGPEPSAHRRLG